jgi:hypothetical protein
MLIATTNVSEYRVLSCDGPGASADSNAYGRADDQDIGDGSACGGNDGVGDEVLTAGTIV